MYNIILYGIYYHFRRDFGWFISYCYLLLYIMFILYFETHKIIVIEISLLNRLMMELYCHPLSGKCAQSWSSILGGNWRKVKLKYKIKYKWNSWIGWTWLSFDFFIKIPYRVQTGFCSCAATLVACRSTTWFQIYQFELVLSGIDQTFFAAVFEG